MEEQLDRPAGRLFAEWLSQSHAATERDFERLTELHPKLAAQLRELRRAHDSAEVSALDPSGPLPPVRTDVPLPPTPRLHEFECTRRIGRGGMGELWEAYDHALKRVVALKLLPHGALAGEREIARFQREAVASARVRHDGVVAIFKAGSDQGLHYIAQELVAGGRTLRDEMEEWRHRGQGPAPRQLAELFARIARGLAAAHEAGVVHRDVKPQNILITPDGTPKVADFGLARLEGDLSLSHSGAFVGTYFYASPEQVRPDGREVDARSDVFSLGATLYECLAWRRPFEGDNVQAVVDAITREDPPDPRRSRPSVPADLALIALKALEKRRENRYASMRELEQDLERTLAHVPIRARAPSPARRAHKWLLRHPTASATIGLSLLAFAALLVLTLRAEHLRRVAERAESDQRETSERLARANADLVAAQAATQEQAEAARTEAALSREVEDFLTGLFRSASPDLYGHEELTLRDVVDRGRASIEAGEVEQPIVRARLATTLADVLAKLGAFSEASQLLSGAAATWKELGLDTRPEAQETRFAQAIAAYDAGRDPEALALVDQLRALGDGLDPALAPQLARARAEILARLGRFADAEASFQEAEERYRAAAPHDPDEFVLLRTRQAELLLREARFEDAERVLAQDSARLEPLLDSGNPIVLDHFNLLAVIWQNEGRAEESQRLLERVVAAAEEHLGRDHARSINFRGNLATALEARGEVERAETIYAECCDLGEARYGHDSTEATSARHNLANCLARQERFDEAEPILRELLADLERLQGVHHQQTVRTRASLGYTLIALGKSREAAELLELVLQDFPAAAPERPAIVTALAKLHAQLGE